MEHEHSANLAHHFATPTQQFEASKLGVWLFLATEILLFGGLFCVYAIYRAHHPEIFQYAHLYLDKMLGGINTLVLICSSLTMAWAVRCAQQGQQRGLALLLALTLLCACGFLGIKYVEYKHKWKDGLLPGRHFAPTYAPGEHGPAPVTDDLHAQPGQADTAPAPGALPAQEPTGGPGEPGPAGQNVPASGPSTGVAVEPSKIPPVPPGPTGLADRPWERAKDTHHVLTRPSNVHIFFGIYFIMTGLHGLHVVAGMVVIGWLLRRALQGHFGPAYFAPVDFGGLYWHLVDLIWIYLFPLLYLIH